MLHVDIPGGDPLRFGHLVMDVNGTLSDRGAVIEGVADRLGELASDLALHVLSADTFGTAEALADQLGASFRRVQTGEDKRAFIEDLGPARCVAVGNGANDVPMLSAARLSIAVLGPEGTHSDALRAATITCLSIVEALDLLLSPQAF
jgi:P-type E1-E2 ATPase